MELRAHKTSPLGPVLGHINYISVNSDKAAFLDTDVYKRLFSKYMSEFFWGRFENGIRLFMNGTLFENLRQVADKRLSLSARRGSF
jgi:hypothetical protein